MICKLLDCPQKHMEMINYYRSGSHRGDASTAPFIYDYIRNQDEYTPTYDEYISAQHVVGSTTRERVSITRIIDPLTYREYTNDTADLRLLASLSDYVTRAIDE